MQTLPNKHEVRKILVIGGTGETGRRILFDLRQTHPELSLTAASRSQPRPEVLPEGVASIVLDVDDEDGALEIVRAFDLVIVALGPMAQRCAAVHRLCLRAGVDSLDINDSAEAAAMVHDLDSVATAQGTRILTGMGLCPGLSTLMWMKLADARASSAGVYRMRLYMGAAYGGGPASAYTILESFQTRMDVLRDGQRITIDTPWRDGHEEFTFPGHPKPVRLVPYAAPEIAGLCSPRLETSTAHVRELDCRYHIQFLSQGMARTLAQLPLKQEAWRERMARRFYAGGQSLKKKPNADPDTCVWAFPDDDPTRGLILHGSSAPRDLTAAMACAVVECILEGALEEGKGVHAIEMLSPASRRSIERGLAQRGVTWRRADAVEPRPERFEFGWIDAHARTVETLRNYGRNWYTVQRKHPRVASLQSRYLLQSRVWRVLRQTLGPARFAMFVSRVMLRWRSDRQALAGYRQLGDPWDRITKDISMFTSGYRSLRDLFGAEQGLDLYREMFLETGAMEMRWLWPDRETLLSLDDPAGALQAYWLAFMRSCQETGLVVLKPGSGAMEYEIVRCTYAKMFAELGCAEMGDLVREMERDALQGLARGIGMTVDWESRPHGGAMVGFRRASVVDVPAWRQVALDA